MLVSLAATLALASMLLTAYGLGRWLLDGLTPPAAPPRTTDRLLADVTWSIGLGLVGVGVVLMGLGFLGLLYVPLINALTAAGAVLALRGLLAPPETLAEAGPWTTPNSLLEGKIVADSLDESRHQQGAAMPDLAPPARLSVPKPPRWLRELLLTLAGIAALAAYVSALAPPTDGDALCYHLELPKVFLNEHRIVYLPDSANSSYPMLAELWFLWGLSLQGPVAAQLVHWSLGLLLALAAVALAQPFLGRHWSLICGALVLMIPGVTNQMTAPLNDVAVATFTTLALAAWWRAAVDDEPGQWAAIAGLMLGGAFSIKFTALVFAFGMGVAWLILIYRSDRRAVLTRQLAVTAVLAASVSGGWYLRSAWHTGDPVFPVLTAHGPLHPARDPALKRPFSWRPADVLLSPWRITIEPERFGGRSHQLGALFLALLPVLLVARRLRGLAILLGISAVYAILWYGLRQNVRFLYPIAPLLLVPAAWAWAELSRFPREARWTATSLVLAIVTSGAAISVARAAGHWAVACGWQSRDDYLARSEPTYEPAQAVNLLLSADARIFSQEQRAFYFERPLIRENMYRRRTAYHEAAGTVDWLDRLRADRFTHLLLAANESTATTAPGILDGLVAEVERSTSNPPWREIAVWRYEQGGATRCYRLLELVSPERLADGRAK